MEPYEIDPIKIEKEKAMQRYQTFRKIATIVRTLEILIAISLLLWSFSRSSAYFPIAVNLAGEFFRRFFSLVFSPRFVFIIGNIIVITLFVNSGDHHSPEIAFSAGDIFSGEEPDSFPVENEREREIAAVEDEFREAKEKSYRKTRSSVGAMIVKEEKKKELRRSETEPSRKTGNGETETIWRRRLYQVDDLSSEEFRRKVEAFIEKQQQFLREESKAVVLSNLCHSL